MTREIFDIIGELLMVEGEETPPFEYLGLAHDFNGVQVEQASDSISITAEGYINRVMKSHG